MIAAIDRLIPKQGNPHELKTCGGYVCGQPVKRRAGSSENGNVHGPSIAIHNFPEGIATFASALEDPTLGIAIAVAIAIHNIPEG